MMLTQPKSMQQIAILIITFLAYATSIRNSGSSGNNYADSGSNDAQSDYESPAFLYSNSANTFSSQSNENGQEAKNQLNGFRPSQIIDFTLSDATAPHKYPPSYVDANNPVRAITQTFAQTRNDVDKQFSFPNEEQTRPPTIQAQYSNNYNYQTNVENAVPTPLQSAPILIYRDPFTNENYDYTPIETASDANYHQYQQQQPQEYTVQSSMLVGTNNFDNYQQQLTSRGDYQKRPGYVFDESVRPSNAHSPSASNYANKYSSQYQQHPNAISNYNHAIPDKASLLYNRPISATTNAATSAPHKPQDSAKLSYDSHDYPPPSYSAQETSNFHALPHRSDMENYVTSSHPPSYANNNFANYLQGGEQYTQNFKRPPPSPPSNYGNQFQYAPPIHQRPASSSRPQPPTHFYNNYYDYQTGEIPPSSSNYRPPYRPPLYNQQHPSTQQQQQQKPSGLASLASLFTTTQQYAPQFTNLLLSGLGGGAAAPSNTFNTVTRRPPNIQLIRALENIARNDDLECVPKVLCKMIAGQTQRGQLPSFITSPTITNFLAGFPASSPALIYGRAALLGISGGDTSCSQTYAKCPKNEYEIIYYLNNHRGGFFKLFGEPDEQTQQQQQQVEQSSNDGATSIFSILSALTGNPVRTTTTPRPRPKPKPTTASTDITDSIGNFFTNVLSQYISGVEYQRRRRRRRSAPNNDREIEDELKMIKQEIALMADEDFHDEEDAEDIQNDIEFVDEQFDDVEGRILHPTGFGQAKFFPEDESDAHITKVIQDFNKERTEKSLKFPTATDVRLYTEVNELKDTDHEKLIRYGKQMLFSDDDSKLPNYVLPVNFVETEASKLDDTRRGKEVIFRDDDAEVNAEQANRESSVSGTRIDRKARIIFPDYYNELLRKGRILNKPTYAPTYVDYIRNSHDDTDRFVLPNSHRRPHYQQDATATHGLNSINNNYYNSIHQTQLSNYAQNSHTSNTNIFTTSNYDTSNNNRYTSAYPSSTSNMNFSHYNYPNNNYVSNNRYSSNYQRTTRRPVAKREDDKNVYITNGHGVTEYYLTPDGRKIYL